MYKFIALLLLLSLAVEGRAQPIPPTTAYTFLFGTNRTALEARTYLGIDIIAGGASNAVVNINGTTNAQQRFQITTNNIAGVPVVTTNGAGAINTNLFNHPYAGPAVSGILHSNDYAALLFGTELDSLAELNALLTDPDIVLSAFSTSSFAGVRIVPPGSTWQKLTNEIGLATASEPVLVYGGTYFGSNAPAMTWAGKRIHFLPGVTIIPGLSNSYNGGILFGDRGVALNSQVTGYPEFWFSNTTQLAHCSNAASKIFLEVQNAYGLNEASPRGLYLHEGGEGDYLIRDSAYQRGYDTATVYGGNAYFHGHRMMSGPGNQAIEAGDGGNGRKFIFVNLDIAEPNTNFPCGGPVVTLDTDCHFKIGKINCYSNSYAEFLVVGTGDSPILEAGVINGPTNNTGRHLLITDLGGPPGIVRNTRLVGSLTAAPIEMAGGVLILDGGSVEAGAVSPETITGGGSVVMTGEPALNKAVNGGITLLGGSYRASDTYPARAISGLQEGSITVSNLAASIFNSPTAGQVVGFHNANTFTNFSAGSGSPGGSTTQIQYNNASAFDGASGIVVSGGENDLNVTGTVRANSLSVTQDLTFTGTGTARVRLPGTTLGFTELQAPASGQSNVFVLHGAGTTVGQGLVVYSVTAQAGTNFIVLTNAPLANRTNVYEFALSDETTVITTGTAKVTWRAPHAMTIVAVRASVTGDSSSGNVVVDINDEGTTILSTKLSIDVNEESSQTATTPAVISDSAIADDGEITFDVDSAGTGSQGLKVKIFYIR